MIPDFFQSTDPTAHFVIWKTIIAIFFFLFASFVGVEIRVGNDDEEH